jgi:hypothetical protein
MAIDPTDLESYFLERVNETRAAAGNGALPLTFDGELNNAADDHNAWMDATDTQSHIEDNKSRPYTRAIDAGYDALHAGENVLIDDWDENGSVPEENRYWVEHSHGKYVDSPGHYATMIDPRYKHIGISFFEGDKNGEPAVYSTLLFGEPTPAEDVENSMTAPGGDAPLPRDTLIDPDEYWERRGDEPRPELTPVEPPPPHHPRPPSPCDTLGLCNGPIIVG